VHDNQSVAQSSNTNTPNPISNYLAVPGTGEVLAFNSTAGGTFVPIQDGQGSALGLVNSGNVLQTQFTYDPFGNPTTTGTTSQYPYLYRGMEYDATGLYYGGGVYYSPNLGRPLQQVTPGGGGGGQGGINVSPPPAQGSSGGLGGIENTAANGAVNLAIGGVSGLSSFFGLPILVGYLGFDIGLGPIAWAATAIGIAIASILDLFGFDLFGGGGSAPVIPPGYYRPAHYVSSQFIGCEALTPNMEDSYIIESVPAFEGLEIGALLNPVVIGAVVTVGAVFLGWEFYTHFTKGGDQRVVPSKIAKDYYEYVSAQKASFRKFKSRCDWLLENGSRYSKGEFKKAARQWGCRYRNN
jgi:hypothetical protein